MSRYQLKEPNELTKKRVLEVKFYLFAEVFLNKLGEHSVFKTDMLGILANAFNLNTTALLSALNTINHPMYKPSQKEIVVASHLMDIIVRAITNSKLVSVGGYYNILKDYIIEGEPTLFPKLPENLHEHIELFFTHTNKLFELVSYVVKGDVEW